MEARSTVPALAAILAVALPLAACGDDDGGTPSADAGPKDATADVVPDGVGDAGDAGDAATETSGETTSDDADAGATDTTSEADAGGTDVTSGPCGQVGEGMTCVPGGPFYMGCNEETDGDCLGQRLPQHEVDVPAFAIDVTEVRRADYMGCVEQGACAEPDCDWNPEAGPHLPVVCVDWSQAQAYCEWRGKRLCTEAEWAKAARGGCDRYEGDCATAMPRYPWGNEEPTCDNELANVGGCEDGPTEVGAFPDGASPYGVHDMAGNVWEWVADCWHPWYEGAPDDGSAWVDEGGCGDSGHATRGGDFDEEVMGARLRMGVSGGGLSDLGFRCCADGAGE